MARNTLLIQFSQQSFGIIKMYIRSTGFALDFKFGYFHMTSLLFCYSGSSPNGQLYLRPPSQNPVFLNSHTNSVFFHSRKRQLQLRTPFSHPRVSAYESFHCSFAQITKSASRPGLSVKRHEKIYWFTHKPASTSWYKKIVSCFHALLLH